MISDVIVDSEFLVMPFGLTNTPTTFQSTMNRVFQSQLRRFVLVFFDDILAYSRTWEEHLVHLDTILGILDRESFYAKESKCALGMAKLLYLGPIIRREGVRIDPDKVCAIIDWPTLETLTQLRGFVGLCAFYRRFVSGFSWHAAPLTDLTKKCGFIWTPLAQGCFEKFKHLMTTCLILALPDFTKPF